MFSNLLLKSFWLCVCCLVGCPSFQTKSLPCSQSELISYPVERNVHDALPSPPLNGEHSYCRNIFTRTLLHLSLPIISVIAFSILFLLLLLLPIQYLPVIWYSGLFLPSSIFPALNSLWLQWSVWAAHARLHRQTVLSPGCPFFPLAQPITQLQYKHSFLWSTEPLWKRPFNWSSIKAAQPTLPPLPLPVPSLSPPSPPPARGPFTERFSDKQDRGSMLRQSKPSLKPV